MRFIALLIFAVVFAIVAFGWWGFLFVAVGPVTLTILKIFKPEWAKKLEP